MHSLQDIANLLTGLQQIFERLELLTFHVFSWVGLVLCLWAMLKRRRL